MNSLDPKKMKISRADSNLVLKIEGVGEYRNARALRAFPLSAQHRYVSFRDEADIEIGILKNIGDLDEESKRVLEENLRDNYSLPEILEIDSLEAKYGTSTWQVQTDQGPRRFQMVTRDDVRTIRRKHLVLRDVDGERYRISDYKRLDEKSRMLLERYI